MVKKRDAKFRPGRSFCGAQSESARLMPGSVEVITMYYALAAGLREVLERCRPGSMLGPETSTAFGEFLHL